MTEEIIKPIEVQLGRQGRLVLPAPLRRKLEIKTGDKLLVREEMGQIVIEKPATIKKRLKARFSKVPKERSLADELIAERREEAHFDL